MNKYLELLDTLRKADTDNINVIIQTTQDDAYKAFCDEYITLNQYNNLLDLLEDL